MPMSFVILFVPGFSGESINLYSYAANNPVMLKDPRGRCLNFANLAGGRLGHFLVREQVLLHMWLLRRYTIKKLHWEVRKFKPRANT